MRSRILLLPLVLGANILFLSCGGTKVADAPEVGPAYVVPSPTTKLILETDAVSAWTSTTNGFAGGGKEVDVAGDKKFERPMRGGIFFQFGQYEGDGAALSGYRFTEFELSGPSVPESQKHLKQTDGFYWINVESKLTLDNPDDFLNKDVILAASAKHLYKVAADGPCREVPGCPCACEHPTSRWLNPYLPPKALITYWRGSANYSVAARPFLLDPSFTRFEFEFNDVAVQVFKEDASGEMIPQGTPMSVETITVRFVKDFEHPKHMDPPWP